MRVCEIAHHPERFEDDSNVQANRDLDGRRSFTVRLDDEGGWRILHLRLWTGRTGLAAMADRFRAAPGFTMWTRAMALVEAGIPTPRPLLAAERRKGTLEWSAFATDQLDATIGLDAVLQQVAGWGEGRQVNFARHLAGCFKKLRANRLAMDEVSGSSFLVRGVPDFEFELLVCEPEKVSVGGEFSVKQIESRILFGLSDKAVKAFFSRLG